MVWLARVALGWKREEDDGSNFREFFARICLYLTFAALSLQAGWIAWLCSLFGISRIPTVHPILMYTLLLLAAIVFVWCICFVFVLGIQRISALGNERFDPAPLRLIRDLLISSAAWIVAFALVYGTTKIIYNVGAYTGHAPTDMDRVYFSVVVFTTLGFGDFLPAPDSWSRHWAAAEAILGNIHLGLLAGAFYFALGQKPSDHLGKEAAKESGAPAESPTAPAPPEDEAALTDKDAS
jgi:hypothetical protein